MFRCDGGIRLLRPQGDAENSAPREIVRSYASELDSRGMSLSEMVADKRALRTAPGREHAEQCLLATMLDDQSI